MASSADAGSTPGPQQKAPEAGAASGATPSHQRQEPEVSISDVFSMRKPKDAKAGLSSGLKSIGKGLAAGVVGLVAGPVVGARQEGFVGAAKGVAAGVVGAVVLPVTGVTVGAVQMVRGVVNTAEAVSETKKGKIWDQERREWVDKPDGTIITADAAKASTRDLPRRPASGIDYYAVLQVDRDATPEQIKKAYYVLARKWHPDKNPGDATAHERFQQLGEAYQVLGNEELRARYDAHGADGLDVSFMDSSEFFAMLFGSDLFEHLVGELAIAAAARLGNDVTPNQLRAVQGVRVEKLVVNLKALIQRYVAGDQEGFKLAMQEEAGRLVTASFGPTMLHAVGGVYGQQADIALGNVFSSLAAKMKASTENMKSQINAASAAIKVYQAHQKIEAWQRDQERLAATDRSQSPEPRSGVPNIPAGGSVDGDSEDDEAAAGASDEAAAARKAQRENDIAMARQALEEAALPLMLEAMWAANVLDIQATLRKVCQKVLHEPGVPPAQLKARALALRELGAIFKGASAPGAGEASSSTPSAGHAQHKAGATASTSTLQDAKRQMEEAMMKVLEKRAGAGQEP